MSWGPSTLETRTGETGAILLPYPEFRTSEPGDALGLKVPVVTELGMSLRRSLTQVATSMFICLAR